jgi:plastocyanin
MRTLLTALTLLSTAAGLTACGGGDDKGGGEGGGGPAVTVQKGQPVHVKGLEYRFEPSTVVVEGAGPVEIEFENAGSLAHNVRLVKDGQEVGGSETFQGGETKSSTVDLQPGDYQMICTVGDHARLGMEGKLTVK